MIDPKKYFDHNATTPLSDAAREAWLATADRHWENPSSLYREAGQARQMLEDLREELADELEIDDAERIVFTSGATEANNAVIHHWSRKPGKIAISAIEHPSARAAAEGYFGKDRVIEIPVDRDTGMVQVDALEKIPGSEKLAGISVMAANNETGTLQPWREIAALCRSHGVPFHCDAVQLLGKAETTGLAETDFFSASAHKFGGPKGVGFLVIAEEFESCDLVGLLGGAQENGRRGGTEDLAGIAAMVAALKNAQSSGGADSAGRDAFEEALLEAGDFKIIGQDGPRLFNTSLFVVPREKNLKWLTRLSQRGFGVSTGSACSAGRGNPSKVMEAMGLDFGEMGRVIRASGGRLQREGEWMALFEALMEVKSELES